MKVIDTLGQKEGQEEIAVKNKVKFSKTFILTFYFLRFCSLEIVRSFHRSRKYDSYVVTFKTYMVALFYKLLILIIYSQYWSVIFSWDLCLKSIKSFVI
jgi:hypothetical protein